MPFASSRMSVEELDARFEQAVAKEEYLKRVEEEDAHYLDMIEQVCNDDYWAAEELPVPEWTDEDEAALEQYEEDRRLRIAERNEY